MSRAHIAWLAMFAVLCLAVRTETGDARTRGDAAWADRAVGARDGRAAPGPVERARRAYEVALAAEPEDLEASWKLLRALHFAGDFTPASAEARLRIFERAREVSEQALDGLASRIGGDVPPDEMDPATLVARLDALAISRVDVARLYFWSAIDWAAWSRDVGLVGAVRQGVASRLHRYARVAVALEPDYEGGGAFRLLGRLHAELPRVPFLTGWVDRARAVPLLERARAIAPEHPGNPLLLALTLLDLAPDRRDEALSLLESIESLPPRPSSVIEDLAIRAEARRVLDAQ